MRWDSCRRNGLALLVSSTMALGCDRAVTLVSTEKAPWWYVEQRWGGLELGEPRVEGSQFSIPLRLFVHGVRQIDSGICVRRVEARVDGLRVILRIDKCLCGPGVTQFNPSSRGLTAAMQRPRAGTYEVVYDDEGAGFPRVGQITVP